MSLLLRPVEDRAARRAFLRLPHALRRADPRWVPPLDRDEAATFDHQRNRAFRYCEAARALAERDGHLVGRIAVIVNHRYNEARGERTARWGWLEAVEDQAVVAALLAWAEDWARQRGLDRALGPLGLTDQDPEGLLVGGFEHEPAVASSAPDKAYALDDAEGEDLDVSLATVIDDSGSIADCDANFIAQGLAWLYQALPPVYESEMIKFDQDIYRVQDWTSDGDALAAAALETCTSRGSTALWDALYAALGDVDARPETDLRAILVLSDGVDNASDHGINSVTSWAKDIQVPILVVGLGYADIFELTKLGKRTRGGFVYVPSGDEMLGAFETATDFVTWSYIVEWEADKSFDDVTITASLGDGATESDTLTED